MRESPFSLAAIAAAILSATPAIDFSSLFSLLSSLFSLLFSPSSPPAYRGSGFAALLPAVRPSPDSSRSIPSLSRSVSLPLSCTAAAADLPLRFLSISFLSHSFLTLGYPSPLFFSFGSAAAATVHAQAAASTSSSRHCCTRRQPTAAVPLSVGSHRRRIDKFKRMKTDRRFWSVGCHRRRRSAELAAGKKVRC